MPTPTYKALATITLGSSAATVTFSSIPASYRDLVLISNIRQNTTGARQCNLQPNGDTGNAFLVYMDGSGSAAFSGTTSALSMFYMASGPAANTNVISITQILDYSATDKFKTILTRAGSSFDPVSTYAAAWTSTSAITSMTIFPNTGGNLSSGSTFDLYGIAS
jgi:hypothetical protein